MATDGLKEWDGIGPVTRLDEGTAVRLSRNEQQMVEDLALHLQAPKLRENDRRAHGPFLDRLLFIGLDADTTLYMGMIVDHVGRDLPPSDLALALATRSPNAFPKKLRRYVKRFQAFFSELVKAEDRADERAQLAMLRDHFGPDPDLFD